MNPTFKSEILRVGSFILFLLLIAAGVFAQTDANNPFPQLVFPNFQNSTILMKSGTKTDAFLNYNSVDEEMLIDQGGEYRSLNKPEEIDTIFIQNRKFVLLNKVFCEQITKGNVSIFFQYKSRYMSAGTPLAYGMTSQTNASMPVSVVKGGNQVRHLEVPDNVKVTNINILQVRIGNELHRFSNIKQFSKLFGEHEAQIKEFAKTNNLDVNLPKDLKKLGAFAETFAK